MRHIMKSLSSGYVHLRVRERRFVGTWAALKNVIITGTSLFQPAKTFIVPLNHLLINGQPNRFTAVEFRRGGIFHLIDDTVHSLAKPIRYYRANTVELSDAHIEVLTKAIIQNGCCQEHWDKSHEANMYRL